MTTAKRTAPPEKAAKPRQPREKTPVISEVPQNLDNHPFYGLKLDAEQKEFRSAIWDPSVEIVFCNSVSGSGKTLVSLATANLLVEHGVYDEIYYMMAAGTFEKVQGYLSGNAEKNMPYSQPLYQAVLRIGLNPMFCLCDESMIQKKSDTAYIFPMTDSYIRGLNLGDGDKKKAIVLIDEAQNITEPGLRRLLTRINGKAIVVGHTGQCDLPDPKTSGFERCINHFMSKKDGKSIYVELKHNYRGYVSRVADEKWE